MPESRGTQPTATPLNLRRQYRALRRPCDGLGFHEGSDVRICTPDDTGGEELVLGRKTNLQTKRGESWSAIKSFPLFFCLPFGSICMMESCWEAVVLEIS